MMYYSYVEIEYVATSFSPARMDLAVKLLKGEYIEESWDTKKFFRQHHPTSVTKIVSISNKS